MSEWQLIKTVPKDGRSVLLFTPPSSALTDAPYYSTGGMWVGYWFSSPKEIDDGWQEPTFGGSPGDAWEPTHWMPLPEGPQ
jgi:hypothetical protein